MAIKKRKTAKGIKYDLVVHVGFENGKRKQQWIRGFNTIRQAEKAERDLRYKVDEKRYVKPTKYTLEEWLMKILDRKKNKVVDSTINSYLRYKRIVCNLIGNTPLKNICSNSGLSLIKDLQSDLLANWEKRTVKHIETWMKNALQHAEDEGQIVKNPYSFKTYEPVKPDNAEKPVFEPSEVSKLIAAAQEYCNERDDQRWYALTCIALGTGMRLGELAGLKWGDINTEQRYISVKRSISWIAGDTKAVEKATKSEAGIRDIGLMDADMAMLKDYRTWTRRWLWKFRRSLTNSDYVFPFDDGKPFHKSATQRRFEQIEKRAKVRHLGLHACRHTHASNLIRANENIKKVQKRLGHSTPSITADTYAHLFKEDVDRDKIAIANANIYA